MSLRAFLLPLGIASQLLCAGCYFSSPPSTPHTHSALDPAKLTDLVEHTPVSLRSSRLLVIGRFDSTAVQPIGGLYDRDDYSISPLYRTYFFKDAALEVFEATTDALRATGLDVRKDYATIGEPTLLEPRLRARQPLIISALLSSLQHDQIRVSSDEGSDYEVARMTVQVQVKDADGALRFEKALTIEGRLAAGEDLDVLRLLGVSLGESLSRDGAFVRAVEAK